ALLARQYTQCYNQCANKRSDYSYIRRKKYMQSSDGQQKDWWAEGDTPVRNNSRVTYLVDGRTAMLTMCLHFFRARQYIYIAGWGMTPGMELVRGKDQRAGPDG